MNGQMIEFEGNGDSFSGYLSTSQSGAGPGIIVIQEWWGLVGHIKDVTDRFAADGFTALAPDFYHGKLTAEPDEAGSLMMALDIDNAAEVIRGAISALLNCDQTVGDRVGVVGFCMGGQLAMYSASIDDRIGACVNFYGVHPNVKPNWNNVRCPILGNFASEDAYTGPEVVASLSNELETHGIRHDFKVYEGRQHAFFNSARPTVYEEDAAEDSWCRTINFFKAELA